MDIGEPRERQQLRQVGEGRAVGLVERRLAQAEVPAPPASVTAEAQYVVVEGERGSDAVRDASYTVTEPPRASAPASGVPDPGSAQAIAYDLVAAKGWSVPTFRVCSA